MNGFEVVMVVVVVVVVVMMVVEKVCQKLDYLLLRLPPTHFLQ